MWEEDLTLGSCHVLYRRATSALGWCCPPWSSGRCPPSCPPRPPRAPGATRSCPRRPCRGWRCPGVEKAPGVASSTAPPDSLETHSLLSSHVTQIPQLLIHQLVWLVLAYLAHLCPLVQPPPLSHQPGGRPASQARWSGCECEERSWVRGGGAQATDPHWGKKALCAAWRRTGEPYTHFCGRDVLHNSHKHENTTNTHKEKFTQERMNIKREKI